MELYQRGYAFELDPDVFDEDQSDVSYLKSKPGCFIVFGPPGAGKSLVARLVAQFWKCLLISPETVAIEALKNPETGSRLKEDLHTKDGIQESAVFDLLRRKLESQAVRHYGYVLDDFPTPEHGALNLDQQFDFLRNLEMSVDYVIVLRFPLEDAVRRKETLYFHGPSGLLVPEAFISETTEYEETTEEHALELDADEAAAAAAAQADIPKPEQDDGVEPVSEEGDEIDEEGDEDDQSDTKKPVKKAKKRADKAHDSKSTDRESAEGATEDPENEALENVGEQSLAAPLRNTKRTTFGHVRRRLREEKKESPPDNSTDKSLEDIDNDLLLFRQMFFPDVPLVRGKLQFPNESLFLRIEDSAEWTQDDYMDYKKSYLPYIENFMAAYYPLRVIEIDGHTPLHEIPRLILTRLECLRLQKPPIPHPLTDLVALQRIQEEVPELEEQCKQALLVGAISPRWKWRRAVCGTFCPVSLFEGLMVPGVLPYATVFLDRLYFLADKGQQEKFITNPRLYILPPNPRVPTRFVVLGPARSGKTMVSRLLGQEFDATVLDLKLLEEQVQKEQKDTYIAAEKTAAGKKALELVTAQLDEEIQKLGTAFDLPVTELRGLSPKSPVLEELKGLLDQNRDSLTTPPLEPISVQPAEAAFPLTTPETAPPVEENTLPVVSQRPDDSSSGEAQTPAGTPDETTPPILTELEQARVTELETQLTQMKAGYLAQQQQRRTVDGTFPGVVAEIERLMAAVTSDSLKFDAARYLQLLRDAISTSNGDNDPSTTGTPPQRIYRADSWILDNLTLNPEVISLILELSELSRPTDFLLLKDISDRFSYLRNIYNAIELEQDPSYQSSDDVWEEHITTIAQISSDLGKIETAAGNAGIRVHSVEIVDKQPGDIALQICNHLQAIFKPTVVEYVEPEVNDDEEEERDEENENDTGSTMFDGKSGDETSEKSRPLGETAGYCPIALKEYETLWPGSAEYGLLTYKDKIYAFSSPEAKEKFTKDPDFYLPVFRPFAAPPLRIMVMGVTGSGRTTHARAIAELIDGFVVNLRTYMNELATPKLQKSPVELFPIDQKKPYWRRPKIPLPHSENLPILDKQLPSGLVPIKLPFLSPDPANPLVATAEEQACADSLAADSALSGDGLTGFLNKWTKEPPFAGRNVVFDGFPMYPDDARLILEKGIFPDAVFAMTLEGEVAAERLLPTRRSHWEQEKAKRDEKHFNSYKNKRLEWEKHRNARKAELLAEHAALNKEKEEDLARRNVEAKSKGEPLELPEEQDEQEAGERLEQQLDDDFPEPKLEDEQGEEESEDEESALERLNDELHDKINKDMNNIDGIRELFEEKKIPVFDISTSRSELLARKKWKAILIPLLKKRMHLFESAYAVSGAVAKEMLDASFKRLGKFGTWCPVKIDKGHIFPPMSTKMSDLFPVVYRQYLYLCSSQDTRVEFLARPEYFVRQLPPRLCIPIRLAVIGPPKSGKTTFARRLAEEIGIKRISIGDALRYVQSSLKSSELCRILTVYLTSGTDVPDSLEILCLEALLRTTDCQARGWILDGYPSTLNKLNTMMQRFIVPTLVFELVASNKVCVFRSVIESMTSKKQKLPLFNNCQVVATRLAHYKTSIPPVKSYLQNYTRNLIEIDAADSKWKMWYTALEYIANRTVLVQNYVERREKRVAAPLTGLCVTPHQMMSRLSEEYRVYCPVTYNLDYTLFDCLLKQTYEFIAEYQEKYYLFASRANLDLFLEDPERWLPPRAIRTVQPRELLPRTVKLDELDSKRRQRMGFGGLCPVTYYEHDSLSTGLVYGSAKWMAEYLGKIYQFCGPDCLQQFLSQPHKFSSLTEPSKRPPQPEHPSVLNLSTPPIPYLESKMGPLLVQAITEVSELRPKYPQIGYKESALVFVANYLKFANLNSSADNRSISADKLRRFSAASELAARLMLNAQGIPAYSTPGPQHGLFDKVEELKKVRNELQDDWHTLCPF